MTNANDIAPGEEREPTQKILLARQPIFDRRLAIFGYEMLYRPSSGADSAGTLPARSPEAATARVVINAIMDMDVQQISNGRLAFFNIPPSLLLEDAELPFNPEQVGLDVVDADPADAALKEKLEHLKLDGMVLALDDFTWADGVENLLETVDIVKLNVSAMHHAELVDTLERLANHDVSTLAKRVETTQQFDFCRELGFHYFQGFFLCRPTLVKAQRLPDSKINVMRLIAKLQDPDVSPDELEDIIRHDMALHFRLLRTVNSAYYGLSVQIKSISHAIVYLGLSTIRRWTRLQLIAGSGDTPSEVVKQALVRARMCELLTGNFDKETQDAAFTTGLFSLLDAILELPMDQVLLQLPLADHLEAALTRREGPYGRLLDAVIRYETGEWSEMGEGMYSADNLSQSYLEAVRWADEQYRALTED